VRRHWVKYVCKVADIRLQVGRKLARSSAVPLPC
jgi:hypothetical protein